MKKTHTMSLKEKYFNLIFKGEKNVELRLFDEKRKQINVGDTITFIKSGSDARFDIRVVGLVRAANFERLFDIVNPKKCGFANIDEAIQTMEQFYDKEAQRKNGVIGIVLSF